MTYEQTPDSPILVTAIVNANAFEVANPQTGETQLYPVTSVYSAEHQAERLTVLNGAAGPGTLDVAEVVERLRQTDYDHDLMKPYMVGKAIGLLGKILPPEIISHDGTQDKPLEMTLGNVAVASRKASDEEVASIEQEFTRRTRAEILAADAAKEDLTAKSHAIIGVGDQRFLLELLDPLSVLTIRVIERIAQGKGDVRASELPTLAWKAMSLAERALFCPPESEKVYEPTSPVLRKHLDNVISLTSRLGISRARLSEAGTFRPPAVTITYGEVPLTEPDESLRPIYPPQTSREYIENRLASLSPESTAETALSAEELATAARLVRYINAPGRVYLEHTAALEALDCIMARRGKRALGAIIEQTPDSRSLDAGLARLHAIARDSLGNAAYQVAFRNRTIAGHHVTGSRGNITQLTGTLPAPGTPARTTTRWYINEAFAPRTSTE